MEAAGQSATRVCRCGRRWLPSPVQTVLERCPSHSQGRGIRRPAWPPARSVLCCNDGKLPADRQAPATAEPLSPISVRRASAAGGASGPSRLENRQLAAHDPRWLAPAATAPTLRGRAGGSAAWKRSVRSPVPARQDRPGRRLSAVCPRRLALPLWVKLSTTCVVFSADGHVCASSTETCVRPHHPLSPQLSQAPRKQMTAPQGWLQWTLGFNPNSRVHALDPAAQGEPRVRILGLPAAHR